MSDIQAAELFLPHSGEAVELAGDDGLITKEIMRTGEWGKTPSSKGVIRKPLKVVRDGSSSAKDRIISLSELVKAFNDKAYPVRHHPSVRRHEGPQEPDEAQHRLRA